MLNHSTLIHTVCILKIRGVRSRTLKVATGSGINEVRIHNTAYRGSRDIMEQLGTSDVEVTLVKVADHMFSDPACLQMLQDKVETMLKKIS